MPFRKLNLDSLPCDTEDLSHTDTTDAVQQLDGVADTDAQDHSSMVALRDAQRHGGATFSLR